MGHANAAAGGTACAAGFHFCQDNGAGDGQSAGFRCVAHCPGTQTPVTMKPIQALAVAVIVIVIFPLLQARAVESPAPNWLYRTNMAVETAAERPFDNDNRTFIMNSIPPDTQGAVSPEQQVTATNDIVRIFDRGRRLLGWDWMYSWWKDHNTSDPLAGDRTYFDPRVCYDPLAQRWYSPNARS